MPADAVTPATAGPLARFGLGTAAVGRPGYITLGRELDLPGERSVEALRERTHALLDAAYAAGVRYFDTARSYGRAEEFLAGWLDARPEAAAAVTVGSKWGYTYTADWRVSGVAAHEVKEHSVAVFERQAAQTRALLGRRLDVYLVHSVTPDSPALTDPALHARLADLAAEGVRVGLSTSGPAQAETIRAARKVGVAGRPLFTAVQATWNLLEPSALRAVAARTGAGADAVALAAVAARPWADVVLSGAATEEQLASNLTAARLSLDPADMAALDALAGEPGAYWRHRAGLAWS
ncbi:aldo/keto reductase [Streptomyces sp. SBR177]